ncbi:hypothetical protein PoB_001803000 [Plakobranchus ocellatus]|uniref:Uncharacterized protein n=1 Tax=Plakobranchus ocellatus TaxID=259542 RepID=A0AAV3ZAF6_9GAST|nr:hypothetical protein PoB_001803000 [Plakobranchus ocellatus]
MKFLHDHLNTEKVSALWLSCLFENAATELETKHCRVDSQETDGPGLGIEPVCFHKVYKRCAHCATAFPQVADYRD